MKRSLLIFIVILLSSSLNTAQTNPVTHEIKFDYYVPTYEHWYNLTMNDNSYSISSDDPVYDGLSSEINYFNWWILETYASDGGFFDLNQTDDDPNYVIKYTRLEQSNTISLKHIPIADEIEPGWISMINLVFQYQQRILALDYNEFVWPVASQIDVLESYPEQYSISVLFQRGNDGTRCCFNQNISLYVGIDFDFNTKEEWMRDSTYTDSIFVQSFIQGSTTTVTFPTFFLRTGNQAEIEAYPLDRVTVMIIADSGIALLTSFGEGFNDFLYQSEIVNPSQYLHDFVQYTTIGVTDSPTLVESESNDDLELPVSMLSIFLGLIVIGISRKKI